jgi:formylglycine-generating enzyme required for sulfatase activity
MRFVAGAILALSCLMTACPVVHPSDTLPAPDGRFSAERAPAHALSGRAVFPATLATQASAGEVVSDATVALIDPSNGRTVAGGRTNASGAFALALEEEPPEGAYYRLEVGRRPGGASPVGKNRVAMATILKWTNAGGWSGITGPEVVVNATTTALVLIDAEDGAISFSDLMGKVSGPPGYTLFFPVGSHDVAARVTEVTAKLLTGEDPIGDLPTLPEGKLAPLDPVRDPSTHHDYVLNKNGQASVFVWIPTFRAYQLLQPAGGKPQGYWVKYKPSGTEGVQWAKETFGGFYAGKYEASHNDANGTGTQGTSPSLKVQKGVAPWTNVNWNEAAKACLNYDPCCRLMEDDHWTALAVWATINGVMPYGNNNYCKDITLTDVTFTDDPSLTSGTLDRALTGTGTRSAWVGTTNLTTHTGKTDGVYDLNGNVWEWTGTLGNEGGRYTIHDVRIGVALPPTGNVRTLDTSALLRRYGVPGTTSASGEPLFGNDYFYSNKSTDIKCFHGGCWNYTSLAGVWYASLGNARSYSDADVGFRPALVF